MYRQPTHSITKDGVALRVHVPADMTTEHLERALTEALDLVGYADWTGDRLPLARTELFASIEDLRRRAEIGSQPVSVRRTYRPYEVSVLLSFSIAPTSVGDGLCVMLCLQPDNDDVLIYWLIYRDGREAYVPPAVASIDALLRLIDFATGGAPAAWSHVPLHRTVRSSPSSAPGTV